MRKTICVLAAAVIGIFAGRTDAQTRISGVIMDLDTGEPLIGAAIMVSNTSEGTVADADGHFEMLLKREAADLDVMYIGYRTLTFAVRMDNGKLTFDPKGNPVTFGEGGLKILLVPDEEVLENAVVTGRKNLESLQALKNERIASGFAIENMGAKEMSIKGISDAQESVVKLSGISVADAGQLRTLP